LQSGAQTKEFPTNINFKQSQYAIWSLLNGIISLYIFSGIKTKRREKIRGTIKSALEIFIRGLSHAQI
jgi:hypothetical protein